MRRSRVGILSLASCLLLVACGGSSGGPGPDGSWQGALLAEDDETAGATNVRFAMGPGGHAVVSWTAFHGGLADELINHYDPVLGWGDVEAPHRDIASAVSPSMDLAIDGAGNALGLWGEAQALPGTPSTFFATTYDAGTGTWSAAIPMENDDVGKAQRSAVAAGPGGSFWVLFGLNLGTTVEVHVNHYTPGGGWSGPMLLDSADWDPADTYLGNMDLAVDGAGNAVAAWSRYTDTDSSGTIDRTQDKLSVFARRYDAGTTTWAPRQTMNTTTVNHAYVTDVTVDPTGGFLVLWVQYDAAYLTRGWARFYRSGVLQPAVPLWTHADDYSALGAAIDAGGHATVVASRSPLVAAVRYEPGGGWQTPVLVQDDPLTDVILESFAVNPSGDGFVLWRQDVGGQYDTFACRLDGSSGTWGAPVDIDVPDSGAAKNGARIVVSPAGDAMAGWFADDGLSYGCYAARFRKGVGWSDAQDIDSGPLDTGAGVVGLGVDDAGTVMAAWSQGASDDQDVWFNLFD